MVAGETTTNGVDEIASVGAVGWSACASRSSTYAEPSGSPAARRREACPVRAGAGSNSPSAARRARARLAALGEPDPAPALTGQASRLLAAGDPEGSAYALLLLAQVLQPAAPTGAISSTPLVVVSPATMPPPSTPSLTDTPGGSPEPSATLIISPTPRPTRTLTPTPGLPYVLASQETVCDANLLGALIQVEVRDATGNPIPGVDLLVTWNGGREHIFTGLKPELGDGYADYAMTPGIVYTVQVASGGAAASGLEAPSCESGAATWWGSLLLVFHQP